MPTAPSFTLKSGRACRRDPVASTEGASAPCEEEAGIGARSWSYGQIAIVLVARHERPHRGVAQEKVPARAVRHPADARRAGRRAPIVDRLTERADLRRRILGTDPVRFQAEFARGVSAIISAASADRSALELPAQHLVHADRYIDTRLVLVGDAAHGIHPIAGQGYNLGVRDIAALVEVLIDSKAARPRCRRRPLARALRALACRQFHHGRGHRSAQSAVLQRLCPLLRLLRDVGLAAVNRTPPCAASSCAMPWASSATCPS